jgi:glycosyltransferase involved in cell wall biosynthesis
VDLQRFQPQPRETVGPAVLFVGSFRHLPNLLAFEALRNTIMPAIWREVPECRLNVIAGPDHERAAQLARKMPLLAKDPRIAVQGFVEDVRPAYRECDVVAIPLPVSAGTNIKLMEAMACGRAIVSTPVGCQGLELIDGKELLIREIGPAFAEGLLRLLKDTEGRNAVAATARRTAERRFGWEGIAKDAVPSILNAARLPSRAASASEFHESHKFAGSASQNTSV